MSASKLNLRRRLEIVPSSCYKLFQKYSVIGLGIKGTGNSMFVCLFVCLSPIFANMHLEIIKDEIINDETRIMCYSH